MKKLAFIVLVSSCLIGKVKSANQQPQQMLGTIGHADLNGRKFVIYDQEELVVNQKKAQLKRMTLSQLNTKIKQLNGDIDHLLKKTDILKTQRNIIMREISSRKAKTR